MSTGLDIGSKTIKVVELKPHGDKLALKSAGAVGYSGAHLEQIQDDQSLAQIAQTIKKLISDAKISSRDVSISLPESQVFTRILKFPLLNEQEIASAVKWEAEEYIPLPLNEAVIQHVVLERQETKNPPQTLVLLTAAARNLVQKYVNLLAMANINVVGVETELMSMTRSMAPQAGVAVLVDFGARSTDIAIVKDEQLFFSRSVPTAGEAFTRAVAQALGVTPQQAEEYKRTYGLDENQLEGKVGRALLPIFKTVTEEIKKAVHYFQLDVKADAPSSVILAGGTAGMPGVSQAFTRLLGSEVVIGNAFSKIVVDADSAKNLAGYAPLYTVAVGLAMRGD